MSEWHVGAVATGAFFVIAGIGFLLDALDVVTLRPAVTVSLAVIVIGLVILVGGIRPGGGGDTAAGSGSD